MKGRFRKAVFVLSGVLALGLLWWGLFRSDEPVYQGRRLSSWLEELGRSWPRQGNEASTQAIKEMGTNALPCVIAELKARDSAFKAKLDALLRKQRLISFRFRMAEERRDSAIKALLVLQSGAKPAIPEIRRMLDEPDLVGTATTALYAIGKDSLPELVDACGHTNASVRAQAAFILSKLMLGGGGYLVLYVPARGTNSTDRVSRFVPTLGLDDIAALTRNLSDPRPAVRRASAEALIEHSGIADHATPALVKTLEDPDAAVRRAAAEALKLISPAEAEKAGVK